MISRLKSLELQGYKTFANRTNFQFPGAVTAIVGPNGSGKSNITDALRWVLGEQSYSLLRGKKTEDMIFAGSDRRTRSGMATATVILDNSDNWLPIDYSEVAVTRRAYRDGSNEYLLNGQKVRLRDVSELLAESGLAERTYTIIGQGLVDAALALRAEDRRRLFEEAAGIGLHRSRREEAVRRLKNTQRNLERVNDILTELRPRLRSLERQAKRAEDYELAVSNVRALLKDWYGYHWHRAQSELSHAQNELHEQEQLLHDIRQRAEGFDKDIAELRATRQNLRDELNGYHHKSSQLHSQLEIDNRELAIAEERSQNLRGQIDRRKNDIARSEEELELLNERSHIASQEVERIRSEFQEAKGRCANIWENKDKRINEREAIESILDQTRETLIEVSSHRSDIVARLKERRAQFDHHEKSLANFFDDLEVKKNDLNIMVAIIEQRGGEINQISQVIDNFESKREALQKEIRENQVESEKINKQLTNKQADLVKIKAEFEVLIQAKRTFAGFSDGAKVLLEAGRSNQLKGSKELLGGMIQVPEEFEIAIGAALGDYLEAVILEDQTEIESALSLLEKTSQKAAILPLKKIKEYDDDIDTLDLDLIIGPALDFVLTSDEIKPVVRLLLSNTYLVDTRRSAISCLDQYRKTIKNSNSPGFRIVTLSGEVFHFQGPITTSAADKPVSFSRRREEKKIKASLESVKTDIHEIEITRDKIEERITLLNSQEQDLLGSLSESEQSLEDKKVAHSRKLIEYHQLERELKWQEDIVSSMTAEKKEVHEQIDELKRQASEVSSKMNELEGGITKGQEQLLLLPLDDLDIDLAHWTTRVAVLEQSLTEAAIRHEERSISLQSARKNIDVLRSNVTELTADGETLKEKIELLKVNARRTSEEIEAIRVIILPTEEELDKIEQRIADSLSQESQERISSSRAEQNYTQAKIAQVRSQEALDALRKRIEMDFGLVSYEYLDDVSGPNPLPIEELVEDLPIIQEIPTELEKELNRQQSRLRRIGPINPEAQQEYREVVERFEFLSSQMNDLQEAISDLNQVISELDEIMEREFCNTFEAVAEEFHLIFSRLFGGGSARLVLTDPEELSDTGIDIEARLPGRREQGLSLLSGGERSLTAVALVFALLRVSPTPFCVLDEVDAMLDEANVGRFRELLRELSETTQFIMITHNRATVQVADIIYGVTMGKDSTSQILSLKVDEIEQVV
jgi:chromosome segregation protein